MRAPVRPISGRWPGAVERRLGRFFWVDPTVIAEESASAETFRRAMAALHVGDTIKITGSNRHPESDALLLQHVDLADAAIVDIGASDGSTSIDLIGKLPGFRSYTIADLYLHLTARSVASRTLFYDASGTLILIAGRRLVAWPSLSKAVRALYRRTIRRAAASRPGREVLLLNPSVRELLGSDGRVSYRVHDVFEPWTGPRPDVVKVANLLRRLYFSDDRILAALRRLHETLPEGGHLLVVDNPRIAGISERGGLFRKAGPGFEPVATTEHPPEIVDLVARVGADALPR